MRTTLLVAAVLVGCSPPSSTTTADAGAEDTDAAPATIDARPGTPDAHPTPDARPGTPDARPTPDAPVMPADAAVHPDAQLMPDAMPPACSVPVDFPVTARPAATMTFSASGSHDFVMPNGYALTGALSVTDLPAGGTIQAANVTLLAADGATTYAAATAVTGDTTLAYRVGVPAGSYQVTATLYFDVSLGAGLGDDSIALTMNSAVTICGDTVRDLAFPDLPRVQMVNATVSGLSPLASGGNLSVNLTLTRADGSLQVRNNIQTAADTVTAPILVPAETLESSMIIIDEENNVFEAPFTDVDASADFGWAIPALVQLSGSVNDPSGALSPSGSYAIYYNFPIGTDVNLAIGGNGAYLGHLPRGAAVIPTGGLSLAAGPGGTPSYLGENTYTTLDVYGANGQTPMEIDSDTVLDFTAPSVASDYVALTGTVRDAAGNPIANAVITAVSTSLTDAALAHDAALADVQARADGTFTLHLLRGTYSVRVFGKTTAP